MLGQLGTYINKGLLLPADISIGNYKRGTSGHTKQRSLSLLLLHLLLPPQKRKIIIDLAKGELFASLIPTVQLHAIPCCKRD